MYVSQLGEGRAGGAAGKNGTLHAKPYLSLSKYRSVCFCEGFQERSVWTHGALEGGELNNSPANDSVPLVE